jgi:hypothetical protein
MHTPVALVLFNRPDLTERVFAEIARVRPPTLLLVADGPRPNRPDDVAKCAAARAIVQRIDWPCEVIRNYSDVNLGCGRRTTSGMQWIFGQVDEAIVLEDDTVPCPSFFDFCEAMLERYRDDERVMHVSGDNWLAERPVAESYSFSRYCLSWGWASWRRAFRLYDPRMMQWPSVRETRWLEDLMTGDTRAVEFWRRIFDATFSDKVNTWDYQWLFTIWLHHGLSVIPCQNLVSHLGFDRNDTTHFQNSAGNPLNNLPTREMKFPLLHPAYMARDVEGDQLVFDQRIAPKRRSDIRSRLRHTFVNVLPSPLRKALVSLRTRLT